MKKEARLSATALAEVEVGGGEEDLRCKSLFIVCRAAVGIGIPMGIPMGMGVGWVWGL